MQNTVHRNMNLLTKSVISKCLRFHKKSEKKTVHKVTNNFYWLVSKINSLFLPTINCKFISCQFFFAAIVASVKSGSKCFSLSEKSSLVSLACVSVDDELCFTKSLWYIITHILRKQSAVTMCQKKKEISFSDENKVLSV